MWETEIEISDENLVLTVDEIWCILQFNLSSQDLEEFASHILSCLKSVASWEEEMASWEDDF